MHLCLIHWKIVTILFSLGKPPVGSWIEGRGGPPVLQDQPVNNIPTGDALPPEKMFAITIKFLIDHHSTTSITPHIDPLGFIPSASSPDRLARLFPLGSDGGMIMAITSYLSLSLFLWFPQFPVLVNGLALLRPRNRKPPHRERTSKPQRFAAPVQSFLVREPIPSTASHKHLHFLLDQH